MSNADLSIIVPCFNEAKNIKLLIQSFQNILLSRKDKIEIIIIDGCSTDNTQLELRKVFKTLPKKNFKLILSKKRMGYGFDIVSALKKSNGEILCWTHADLQTDPIDALKAFDYYKNYKKVNNKFIVKGSRKNRKLVERFFTFGMEIITFFILNIYLKDINAQPKLFSRTFFKNFLTENHPNDFSLDTHLLILAKRNGYEIKSFKVDFKNRIHGQAKGGGGGWIERINLIIRTLKYIIRLRKKLY